MDDDVDDRFAGIDIESLLNRVDHRKRRSQRIHRPLYEAPEFIRRLNGEETVLEGQSLSLECKVVGFPAPTLRWFKDSEEIYDHPRISVGSDGTGCYSLTIRSVNKGDEAAYRCKAENMEGCSSCVFFLSVRCKPKSRKRGSRSSAKKRNVSFPPMFSTIVEKVEEEEKMGREFETLPPSPLTEFYYALTLKGRQSWPSFVGDWAYVDVLVDDPADEDDDYYDVSRDQNGFADERDRNPSHGRMLARRNFRRRERDARSEAKKRRMEEEKEEEEERKRQAEEEERVKVEEERKCREAEERERIEREKKEEEEMERERQRWKDKEEEGRRREEAIRQRRLKRQQKKEEEEERKRKEEEERKREEELRIQEEEKRRKEELRIEEDKRREEERLEEERRKIEIQKQEEEKRKEMERREEEERRREEERREEEEKRKVEEQRKEEAIKKEEEKKRLEEKSIEEEQRKIRLEKERLEEAKRKEEELKKEELNKKEDDKKMYEARRVEEQKRVKEEEEMEKKRLAERRKKEEERLKLEKEEKIKRELKKSGGLNKAKSLFEEKNKNGGQAVDNRNLESHSEASCSKPKASAVALQKNVLQKFTKSVDDNSNSQEKQSTAIKTSAITSASSVKNKFASILAQKEKEETAKREREEKIRKDQEEKRRREKEAKERVEREEKERKEREDKERRERKERERREKEENDRREREEKEKREKEEKEKREKEEKENREREEKKRREHEREEKERREKEEKERIRKEEIERKKREGDEKREREERERKERVKIEEQTKKEADEKERIELKEREEKESKQREERQIKEKEEVERKEREGREIKEREEKVRREKEDREKQEREEMERKERGDRMKKEMKEKEEKERQEREENEKAKKEEEEKINRQQESKQSQEEEERIRNEKEILRQKQLQQKKELQLKQEQEKIKRRDRLEQEQKEERLMQMRKEKIRLQQLQRQYEEEQIRREDREEHRKKRMLEEAEKRRQEDLKKAELQKEEFEVKIYKRDYTFSDLRKSLETRGGSALIDEAEHKYWDDILQKHDYSISDLKKSFDMSGFLTLGRQSRTRARRNSIDEDTSLQRIKRSGSLSDIRDAFTKSLDRPKKKSSISESERLQKDEELLKRAMSISDIKQTFASYSNSMVQSPTSSDRSLLSPVSSTSSTLITISKTNTALRTHAELSNLSVDVKAKRKSFHDIISHVQSDSKLTRDNVRRRASMHFGSSDIPRYKRLSSWSDDINVNLDANRPDSLELSRKSGSSNLKSSSISSPLTSPSPSSSSLLPSPSSSSSSSTSRRLFKDPTTSSSHADKNKEEEEDSPGTKVRPFVYNSIRTIARSVAGGFNGRNDDGTHEGNEDDSDDDDADENDDEVFEHTHAKIPRLDKSKINPFFPPSHVKPKKERTKSENDRDVDEKNTSGNNGDLKHEAKYSNADESNNSLEENPHETKDPTTDVTATTAKQNEGEGEENDNISDSQSMNGKTSKTNTKIKTTDDESETESENGNGKGIDNKNKNTIKSPNTKNTNISRVCLHSPRTDSTSTTGGDDSSFPDSIMGGGGPLSPSIYLETIHDDENNFLTDDDDEISNLTNSMATQNDQELSQYYTSDEFGDGKVKENESGDENRIKGGNQEKGHDESTTSTATPNYWTNQKMPRHTRNNLDTSRSLYLTVPNKDNRGRAIRARMPREKPKFLIGDLEGLRPPRDSTPIFFDESESESSEDLESPTEPPKMFIQDPRQQADLDYNKNPIADESPKMLSKPIPSVTPIQQQQQDTDASSSLQQIPNSSKNDKDASRPTTLIPRPLAAVTKEPLDAKQTEQNALKHPETNTSIQGTTIIPEKVMLLDTAESNPHYLQYMSIQDDHIEISCPQDPDINSSSTTSRCSSNSSAFNITGQPEATGTTILKPKATKAPNPTPTDVIKPVEIKSSHMESTQNTSNPDLSIKQESPTNISLPSSNLDVDSSDISSASTSLLPKPQTPATSSGKDPKRSADSQHGLMKQTPSPVPFDQPPNVKSQIESKDVQLSKPMIKTKIPIQRSEPSTSDTKPKTTTTIPKTSVSPVMSAPQSTTQKMNPQNVLPKTDTPSESASKIKPVEKKQPEMQSTLTKIPVTQHTKTTDASSSSTTTPTDSNIKHDDAKHQQHPPYTNETLTNTPPQTQMSSKASKGNPQSPTKLPTSQKSPPSPPGSSTTPKSILTHPTHKPRPHHKVHFQSDESSDVSGKETPIKTDSAKPQPPTKLPLSKVIARPIKSVSAPKTSSTAPPTTQTTSQVPNSTNTAPTQSPTCSQSKESPDDKISHTSNENERAVSKYPPTSTTITKPISSKGLNLFSNLNLGLSSKNKTPPTKTCRAGKVEPIESHQTTEVNESKNHVSSSIPNDENDEDKHQQENSSLADEEEEDEDEYPSVLNDHPAKQAFSTNHSFRANKLGRAITLQGSSKSKDYEKGKEKDVCSNNNQNESGVVNTNLSRKHKSSSSSPTAHAASSSSTSSSSRKPPRSKTIRISKVSPFGPYTLEGIAVSCVISFLSLHTNIGVNGFLFYMMACYYTFCVLRVLGILK